MSKRNFIKTIKSIKTIPEPGDARFRKGLQIPMTGGLTE